MINESGAASAAIEELQRLLVAHPNKRIGAVSREIETVLYLAQFGLNWLVYEEGRYFMENVEAAHMAYQKLLERTGEHIRSENEARTRPMIVGG